MSGASRWLDAYEAPGVSATPVVTATAPTPSAATSLREVERVARFTIVPSCATGWDGPAGGPTCFRRTDVQRIASNAGRDEDDPMGSGDVQERAVTTVTN